MTPRKLKPKKCKVCKQEFMPFQPLQFICLEMSCLTSYTNACKQRAETRRRTNERRLIREAREKLKSRATWLKEAQTEFNKFIRMRDEKLSCISCQRFHTGQWHCGHYLSVGSNPALRFCEDNCHKQCAPCNNHLSGNIIAYRKALIEKRGLSVVEWLEGPHEPKKYTIDELKSLKAHYKQLTKELQHASS